MDESDDFDFNDVEALDDGDLNLQSGSFGDSRPTTSGNVGVPLEPEEESFQRRSRGSRQSSRQSSRGPPKSDSDRQVLSDYERETQRIRPLHLFSPSGESESGLFSPEPSDYRSPQMVETEYFDTDGDEPGSPAQRRWRRAINAVVAVVRDNMSVRGKAMLRGIEMGEATSRKELEDTLLFELNHLHICFEGNLHMRELMERKLLLGAFADYRPTIGAKERGRMNMEVDCNYTLSGEGRTRHEGATYFKVYQGRENRPMSQKTQEADDFDVVIEDATVPISVEAYRTDLTDDRFVGRFEFTPSGMPRRGDGEMNIKLRWTFAPTIQVKQKKNPKTEKRFLQSWTHRKELLMIEHRTELTALRDAERMAFRGILSAFRMEESVLQIEETRRTVQAQYLLMFEERQQRTELYQSWKLSRGPFLEICDRSALMQQEVEERDACISNWLAVVREEVPKLSAKQSDFLEGYFNSPFHFLSPRPRDSHDDGVSSNASSGFSSPKPPRPPTVHNAFHTGTQRAFLASSSPGSPTSRLLNDASPSTAVRSASHTSLPKLRNKVLEGKRLLLSDDSEDGSATGSNPLGTRGSPPVLKRKLLQRVPLTAPTPSLEKHPSIRLDTM